VLELLSIIALPQDAGDSKRKVWARGALCGVAEQQGVAEVKVGRLSSSASQVPMSIGTSPNRIKGAEFYHKL
jgi:hypothetical protein